MARRGTSLVELLVALLLLQVVGTAALAAALLATRLAARAQRGIAIDRIRRETVHGIAAAPACRLASPPTTLSVTLPAAEGRPALAVRLRCGGTSVIELLVTLTLLGLVGMLAMTIVRGTSRPLARLIARAEAGRTVEAMALLAAREAATPTGVVASVADAGTLALARFVGDGMPCECAEAGIAIARAHWLGDRLPEAGRDVVAIRDSLGGWHHAALTAVTPGRCPTGAPALWLSLDRAVPAGWVVVQEPTRVRAYRGSGGQWLGLLGGAVTAPIQPFAGPLEGKGMTLASVAGGVLATVTPRGAAATTLSLATTPP